MPLGLKLTPPRVSQFYIELYKEIFKRLLFLNRLWKIEVNRMVPGWSPTKNVQMVLISCISKSRGKKIGFQNAIFKTLLVWKYKTHGFYI